MSNEPVLQNRASSCSTEANARPGQLATKHFCRQPQPWQPVPFHFFTPAPYPITRWQPFPSSYEHFDMKYHKGQGQEAKNGDYEVLLKVHGQSPSRP